MRQMLLNWIISAVSLIIVAHLVRGFEVAGLPAALIAAIVIGLVNATLGLIVKIITFPLTLATLGVFWFIINAVMLKLAAAFVPGFYIEGFVPAFFGAVVLSLVNLVLRTLTKAIASSR